MNPLPDADDCLDADTVSQPNYTGSTGYGGAHVSALVGKCGSLDVQDCVDTVNKLVELGKASLGPGKQYIYGGSHGGFLGAHRTQLSARY